MGGLTSTDYFLKLNESYWVILEFAQNRKMKVLNPVLALFYVCYQ